MESTKFHSTYNFSIPCLQLHTEYDIYGYLVLVDEVVAGEVLLGLQGHQLVVVADAHTGRGPLLLVYTAHRSWISPVDMLDTVDI